MSCLNLHLLAGFPIYEKYLDNLSHVGLRAQELRRRVHRVYLIAGPVGGGGRAVAPGLVVAIVHVLMHRAGVDGGLLLLVVVVLLGTVAWDMLLLLLWRLVLRRGALVLVVTGLVLLMTVVALVSE